MKLGVLISGNGSTLQGILNERSDTIDVAVVIATKPSAYGVIRARRAGVPVYVVPEKLRGKDRRLEAERWIHETLMKHKVSRIFLAGFMWVLGSEFLELWKDRINNIHPSLLPAYKGKDGFGDALKAEEKEVGVTIHRVIEDLDSGSILLQRKFEVPDSYDVNIKRLFLHIQEGRVLREFFKGKLWDSQQM